MKDIQVYWRKKWTQIGKTGKLSPSQALFPPLATKGKYMWQTKLSDCFTTRLLNALKVIVEMSVKISNKIKF